MEEEEEEEKEEKEGEENNKEKNKNMKKKRGRSGKQNITPAILDAHVCQCISMKRHYTPHQSQHTSHAYNDRMMMNKCHEQVP